MAFLTDYQGNILDTTGRPLSSFQGIDWARERNITQRACAASSFKEK